MVRTRFAPSPTGYLHIGGLRTALFAYLTAKSQGGKLILRIEDTDRKRYVEGAVEKMIEILDWIGIKFDEGPHAGGNFGPYVQSERKDIYAKYTKELLAKNEAYYCFCTPERLAKMREEQQADKLPPRYDRTCRNLSVPDINNKLRAGEKYVVRQKMPQEGETVVRDELRGEIKFKNRDLEDQVLIKSDGMPTYQFAIVVDDHLMEITQVIRGEEWLPSFPKNILLYGSFGWAPPEFYHLPLTLNKGGGKLSKRQGDVAVEDYRAKGYLPEALLNFSVLLGWHPKGDNEILSLSGMEKEFAINDLGTSPAVFDTGKLDYFNGYYIRLKSADELAKMCLPYLMDAGLIGKMRNGEFGMRNTGATITTDYVKKVIALERERLKKLSEIAELTEFFFKDELDYGPELLIWKKIDKAQIKKNLEKLYEILANIKEKKWDKIELENAITKFLKDNGFKAGDYLWPMRAALTGRSASPGPFAVAEVLGKEICLKRIKKGINRL